MKKQHNNRLDHLKSIQDQLGNEQKKLVDKLAKQIKTEQGKKLLLSLIQNFAQKEDNVFEMMEHVANTKAKMDKALAELPILVLKLPLHAPIPTKAEPNAKTPLNKNTERNLDRFNYDKAKKNYKAIVEETLNTYTGIYEKPTKPIKLVFKIFKKQNRECDVGNYCIVEKFTSDALVELGYIPDDNFKHVKNIEFKWGGIVGEDFAILEVFEI